VRVVFAGTPETALAPLRAVAASRHELIAVVTRPDARSGRGRTLSPSPVALLAEELGAEVLKPVHPRDDDFVARLRELAPDCGPVVAYGALLPSDVLAIPAHGWVNLHFSVLPAWRGAAPVQRSLMAGDEVTGATTFEIVEELDAGPTYGVYTETIRPDDTAGTLLDRLSEYGAGLLVATLDGIEDGELEARPQPPEGLSHAPKLTVDEAEVDWSRPSFAIDRHVRGCTPAPGAWTASGDARLKLGPVRVTGESVEPGRLLVSKQQVLVGTGTTAVALDQVKPPGKGWMSAADWARGLRDDVRRLGRS